PQLVMKALALTSITMMMIFLGIFVITAIEKQAYFLDVAFEVVSAVCTVGLSRGLTSELSSTSQLVIIFLMFTGRLGPLTLAYFIATPHKSRVKYPNSHVQIG
ncbi:MAG: potassium transporter TrkG, partial [Pseudomonadota bacterium]|nr:potassium transporter TrkG [Pseudomonadota bacterium]